MVALRDSKKKEEKMARPKLTFVETEETYAHGSDELGLEAPLDEVEGFLELPNGEVIRNTGRYSNGERLDRVWDEGCQDGARFLAD